MMRVVRFWAVLLLFFQPVWSPLHIDAMVVPSENPGFVTRYHPDGGLEVGDQVSIEIFSAPGFSAEKHEVEVAVLSPQAQRIGEAEFISTNPESQVATLLWAWDTRGLSPGEYTLSYKIEPGGQAWQEKVQLARAPDGPARTWLERDTECCRLHYISGTDAARDIDHLAQLIDQRAQWVANRFNYEPGKGGIDQKGDDKLDVDLIPRILGQGGFTASEVIVSYNDHNYTVADIGMILQHELTHRIDGLVGGDFRPTMLAEGLAVYLTGGHYKPEPIILQAALLPRNGEYLPLQIMAKNFYSHQHEQSYLEAGALVGYMITQWGWQGFNKFYRDIHLDEGQNSSQAIDNALQRHFSLSLQQLDDRFYAWLERQPVLPDMDLDYNVMVNYFDEIRDYQMALDSSAYFREVWLPDPAEMRKRGIVADYVRAPQAAINLSLQALLQQAGMSWIAGQYPKANRILGQVEQQLATQVKNGEGFPEENSEKPSAGLDREIVSIRTFQIMGTTGGNHRSPAPE